MTIRQKRKQIKALAKSVVECLNDLNFYCGAKAPFALSEEEYGWQQKARDYALMLADIDINAKPA